MAHSMSCGRRFTRSAAACEAEPDTGVLGANAGGPAVERLDQRSDVFGCEDVSGVLDGEAQDLAGRRPFEGRTIPNLLRQHLESPVPELQIPRRLRAGGAPSATKTAATYATPNLDAFMKKAMAKEPRLRYGSSEEMSREFERPAPTACSSRPTPRTWPRCSRPRRTRSRRSSSTASRASASTCATGRWCSGATRRVRWCSTRRG